MFEWLGEPSGIPNWINIGVIVSLALFLVESLIKWIYKAPTTQDYKLDYFQGHEQGYRDALEDSKKSDKTSFHGYRKQ